MSTVPIAHLRAAAIRATNDLRIATRVYAEADEVATDAHDFALDMAGRRREARIAYYRKQASSVAAHDALDAAEAATQAGPL